MNIIKSLAVAGLLSLGFSTQASTVSEGISEDAILLFSGNDAPMDEEEVVALAEEEGADTHNVIGIRRANVRCRSFPYFTTTCRVQPRVISVRLVREFGFRRCIPGRTFGATRNSVWVRQGCSGDFVVRYRPRN